MDPYSGSALADQPDGAAVGVDTAGVQKVQGMDGRWRLAPGGRKAAMESLMGHATPRKGDGAFSGFLIMNDDGNYERDYMGNPDRFATDEDDGASTDVATGDEGITRTYVRKPMKSGNRTMDAVNTSVFNPGGSSHQMLPAWGMPLVKDRGERRRRDREEVDDEFKEANDQMNLLVEANQRQADENHALKLQYEQAEARLETDYEYQAGKYQESVSRLKSQEESMRQKRDDMASEVKSYRLDTDECNEKLRKQREALVADSDRFRREIKEGNDQLEVDRSHLVREVAELEGHRLVLQSNLGLTNMSAIGTPDGTNVRFAPQVETPAYVNADGSPMLGQSRKVSSTPMVGILKPSHDGFRPFQNDNDRRNVTNAVYVPDDGFGSGGGGGDADGQASLQAASVGDGAMAGVSSAPNGAQSQGAVGGSNNPTDGTGNPNAGGSGQDGQGGRGYHHGQSGQRTYGSQDARYQNVPQTNSNAGQTQSQGGSNMNPSVQAVPGGYAPPTYGSSYVQGNRGYTQQGYYYPQVPPPGFAPGVAPTPVVGSQNASSSIPAQTPVRRKMSRRSSMSVGMQAVYDNNDCIAGLGVDCPPQSSDGSDVVEWSVRQSKRLQGSANPARRVAITTEPFNGKKPWRDWYSDFVEDKCGSGWSEVEALPDLLRCLRTSAGRIAVNRWRTMYEGTGTYTQLVECASYVLGAIGTEDTMSLFRKRTQKPHENHRMFGLECHDLLHRARPNLSMDDPHFMNDLFKQFICGLKDLEFQQVAKDAWKADTSLTDLFLALENHELKRNLLGAAVPQRTAAVYEAEYEEESEYEDWFFEDEDGQIASVQIKKGDGKKKFFPRRTDDKPFVKKDVVKTAWRPKEGVVVKSSAAPGVPVGTWKKEIVPVSPPMTMGSVPQDVFEDMCRRIYETMNSKRIDRPRTDRSTIRCYRCQENGHFASECQAPNPVIPKRVSSVEGEIELSEN